MDKKIIIVGAENALNEAVKIQIAKMESQGVEVITPEQKPESGITISSSSMADRIKEIILIKNETEQHRVPFTAPLARRERRSKERKNKNG